METLAIAPSEDLLVELTSDIVSAYVSNHVVPMSDLGSLIADVHAALTSSSIPPAAEVVEKQKPAISVRKSLQEDKLTCLECGLAFKSLKRHLMTHHSLQPDEYREKWELPSDYPMVAPAYAEARSRLAKESGLGQRRRQKVA
ncbi:MucR family transcriptional regulator [Rhizobium sp. VS19-DR104.2]|uniref:MucR family transcriptional regulator n=1 Tax=unclassified Rhizobium TaxID=2613769 RepID=UPI001CC335D7|nr:MULTISPECIES: MucR family transcriptional regulator [unclassified Rhizobium]MBZ5761953.1 MucR family transcriptional regulator [Rhizobium sp. VS19-DR96]MBZ5768925.1 MucR family transcriptional regulator [Rhizobium sp. VS19-DR129.2]MBZ5775671.1 MucR family transcriptional regulator [Rhizobium sp. VS19-DRK62.2]MBZ5786831.1 MucR family transcriptional regulator [Rhizobium sp. VS19-DR121]MBZ5805041.1 MucR family transcriptional regulator [Rhizobium sp. VS19-DR181]